MTLSQSVPRSAPSCISATNATVAQWLATPALDFSGSIPGRLTFWVRRSSTFGALLVLDVSSDGGTTWQILAGDSLKSDGQTSYVGSSRDLPRAFAGRANIRFRIRVVPSASGSAGTLRLDDFTLSAHPPYNLSVTGATVSPALPRPGDPIDVTVSVANTGSMPAANFSAGVFLNAGDTLQPVPGACLGSSSPAGVLIPGDTLPVTVHIDPPAEGVNNLLAVVQDTADRDSSDNMRLLEIGVSCSADAIAIDEIMYSPFAGEAEYVELLACGSRAVNLKGWRLVARGGTTAKEKSLLIPGCGSPISPGGYAVLAEDSSIYRYFPALLQPGAATVIIPSSWETRLNNDGATLLILDPWGNVADSVAYSPSWHNPSVTDKTGRSLERILAPGRSNDPANWSTCVLTEGGTPGRRNSVALVRRFAPGAVKASPNPFSPDGDGHEDATVISYSVPAGVWGVSVRIFDSRGRLVRTLATCSPSTGSGECIWDGRDDARFIARMGIYVIYVEAVSAPGGGMYTARGVVALARRLR